ncbi:gp53-like domain-containing protein [Pantoea endophytica]|uniref:gp53-like domain-containing protein n=1 Tax=Pantoea endophytica TaxID=92488 RepID=UPI002413124B|nr:hypothetical protein [Pantoea endophytica]
MGQAALIAHLLNFLLATFTVAFILGIIMDRQIVYPGQIPLETDLLNTNKFAMVGLAKLAAAIMGQNTCLCGLECTPGVPESMMINVGQGQIYALQSIDDSAYSSLAPDTTKSILKQGLFMTPTSFTLKAPVTEGQSINYLIQVTYSDVDTGPSVLPYYNAANPAIAYSGPDNTGAAQSTTRSGVCHVALKAGIAAATGKQMTPSPDAGYISAWVVTVHFGDHVVTADHIRPADGAPFLPHDGFISAIQQGSLTYGEDTGTANQYQLLIHPAVRQLSDSMRLRFRASNTNTGPSSLAVGQLPATSILTNEHQQLQPGDVTEGQIVEVEWNSALNVWIHCSAISSYSKVESDKKFYSCAGGNIGGDVVVEGILKVDKNLLVGEAELTDEGDLKGKQWDGSLKKWIKGLLPKTTGNSGAWYYKSTNKRLIIQGGRIERSGQTTRVAFHIVFPSQCLNVQFSLNKKHKKSVENPYVNVIDNSHFELVAGSGETEFYWVAFGH